MFKKILLATSATPSCDHAARVAFELAKRFKSHICVFHVLGIPSRGYSQMVVDVKTGENVHLDGDYESWVAEEIKTYYEIQLKDYKNSEIDVSAGYPHREILRYARKNKPDLIVMGGSTADPELSSYKKNLAGSTVQRVTKSVPCPVLIVNRPSASFWGDISSIVFGTDFSKASDISFQYAYKIARNIKAGELHIFHSVDLSRLPNGHAVSQDEIENKLRNSRNLIRSKYTSKMTDFNNYTVDVWEGVPYVEIVKYAREKHADLIIMAHKGHETDPEKDCLGSNMEQVIMRATCPVISINRHAKAID